MRKSFDGFDGLSNLCRKYLEDDPNERVFGFFNLAAGIR